MGGWHVNVSGRIAYDRAGDSLTLAGKRGGAHVTVRLRPSGASAASRVHVTAKQLKLRRNYALAANPPASALGN
jgi:hypothetical protein